MSTHIGDAWRAAGLLPIAMPFSVRNSTAPEPGRIRDCRHRLLADLRQILVDLQLGECVRISVDYTITSRNRACVPDGRCL